MRKGQRIAVAVAACALAAACTAAGASPEASPALTPQFVGFSRAQIERVAPPARERLALPAPEAPQRWAALPAPAADAAGLVQQLVAAERAVRDPAVTGAELAYMGHLQQLVYRQLILRPELRGPVFDAIPADLRAAADFNFAAGADLWVFGHVRTTTLPAWHIVDPAPMDELLRDYHEAEARYGVPWYYLAAINLVETRMGRIRGDSYAGAQGPMQFMPATWDAYGQGDVNDPHDAVLAAGRYLHAAGAPARMARAIWAYNHDNDYVDAVTKYAEVMRADPSAYRGYYEWQVYVQTATGVVLLPVGYSGD
jgi:transglycosylase-like protein with SLT domain